MPRLMNLLGTLVSLTVFLGMTTPVLAGPTPTPTATPTGTPTATPSATPTPVTLTLTVSVDTPGPIVSGQTGVVVTIAANENLTVGSTDITFNWDVAGIQVDSASSTALSSFTPNIDNPNQKVLTASATGGSDSISAGTPLMTFLLTANASGVYNLFITDGDGVPPDDLSGPVPPVPPLSIPYTAVGASLTVVSVTPTPTPAGTPTATPTATPMAPTPTPMATPTATPTPTPTPTLSEKVMVCHKGKNLISLPANAVPGHLAHGDTLGAVQCPECEFPVSGTFCACNDSWPICLAIPPVCPLGTVLAVHSGCWACVDPFTCRPVER